MIKTVQANQAFQVINGGFSANIPTACYLWLSVDGVTYYKYEDEEIKVGNLQVQGIKNGTYCKFDAGSDIVVLL